MIRYEFESGQQYVALARGALAGMAETVYLNDGHTGENAATVLFDCTLEDYGAEALVQSFGVPDYPGEHYGRGDTDGRRYSLNLEVRMVNGKFKTFGFDVTDQAEAALTWMWTAGENGWTYRCPSTETNKITGTGITIFNLIFTSYEEKFFDAWRGCSSTGKLFE